MGASRIRAFKARIYTIAESRQDGGTAGAEDGGAVASGGDGDGASPKPDGCGNGEDESKDWEEADGAPCDVEYFSNRRCRVVSQRIPKHMYAFGTHLSVSIVRERWNIHL